MSKGADKLYEMLVDRFGKRGVQKERTLSNNTRIDFFVHSIRTAFEYDGIQHVEYNQHFHGSWASFSASRDRDEQKDILCDQQGIRMIRIPDDGSLDDELLTRLIEETPMPQNEFKLDPTPKQARLQRGRDARRQKRAAATESPEARKIRLDEARAIRQAKYRQAKAQKK